MSDCDLIFVHSALNRGGAETLRAAIIDDLRDSGLRFRICLLRERGVLADEIEAKGVPVDLLGIRGSLFDVGGTWKLARYLRHHRPRIVQSSQFLTNMHSVVAARLAGVPVTITEEHGLYFWKRWYHRLIDRSIVARASAVVACSEAVKQFARGVLRVPPERIHVVPNCASWEHVTTEAVDRAEVLRSWAAEPPDFVVGIVATLRREKGHPDLLEAWRRLNSAKQIPEKSLLLIVGGGPLEANLRREASDLPNVAFAGSSGETARLLRAMDVFVLPSVNEGFGIAIVEAMHAGLPVIATRVGGIPEVIDHEKTGLLVPKNDPAALAEAIARLYRDGVLRRELGAAGREKARREFVPSRYVEKLADVYRWTYRERGREWIDQRLTAGARAESAPPEKAGTSRPAPPQACYAGPRSQDGGDQEGNETNPEHR